MKLQLGIVACLLAGCASQPVVEPQATVDAAIAPNAWLPPDPGTTLRIGVEYLPPEDTSGDSDLIVERAVMARPERHRAAPLTLLERARVPEARHTWALSADDLADIDNPAARITLGFVSDLIREDERQSQREVRLPFLDWLQDDLETGQTLWSEDAITAAQTEWLSANGTSLLKRPMRRMLRGFPIVNSVEVHVDEFRSSFVPLSEPYQQRHGTDRKLGRLSLRVHATDSSDPVEVVYVRRGLRVGSSQETGKASLEWQLGEDLSLTLRARRNWHTDQNRLRADLAYRLSPTSSLRLAAGDDMDFLSTSSIYSLFETPMDGAPGLVLYAVHVF